MKRTIRALAAAALLVGPIAAPAANLSISPASGAGGHAVQLTSSGFDLDGIGYNTGFYVNGSLVATCPFDNRANCTVTINIPVTAPGSHIVTAQNSFGEVGTDFYTVAEPVLDMTPACGPPGTQVTLTGRFYAVGRDAGIYFVNSLVLSNNYPNGEGTFDAVIEIPAAADGDYQVSAINSAGNARSRTFTVAAGGCAVVGQVTDLRPGGLFREGPGGTLQPLAAGDPVRQNDVLVGGDTNGGGRVVFQDNTQFVLGNKAKFRVDEFDLDPSPSLNRARYTAVSGAFFQYLSGLMVKKPRPEEANVYLGVYCCAGIGIRGTEIFGKVDDVAGTTDLYLLHGEIDLTPWATGLTAVLDAPAAIRVDATGLTILPFDDADADGIPNPVDNCAAQANVDQRDADGDGYGNLCDGDLNNSGLTTSTDFNLLRSCLNQPASASALCAAADMNGSGTVTATDFSLLRTRLNTAPGPSGLNP